MDASDTLRNLIRMQIASFKKNPEPEAIRKTLSILKNQVLSPLYERLLYELICGLAEVFAESASTNKPLPMTWFELLELVKGIHDELLQQLAASQIIDAAITWLALGQKKLSVDPRLLLGRLVHPEMESRHSDLVALISLSNAADKRDFREMNRIINEMVRRPSLLSHPAVAYSTKRGFLPTSAEFDALGFRFMVNTLKIGGPKLFDFKPWRTQFVKEWENLDQRSFLTNILLEWIDSISQFPEMLEDLLSWGLNLSAPPVSIVAAFNNAINHLGWPSNDLRRLRLALFDKNYADKLVHLLSYPPFPETFSLQGFLPNDPVAKSLLTERLKKADIFTYTDWVTPLINDAPPENETSESFRDVHEILEPVDSPDFEAKLEFLDTFLNKENLSLTEQQSLKVKDFEAHSLISCLKNCRLVSGLRQKDRTETDVEKFISSVRKMPKWLVQAGFHAIFSLDEAISSNNLPGLLSLAKEFGAEPEKNLVLDLCRRLDSRRDSPSISWLRGFSSEPQWVEFSDELAMKNFTETVRSAVKNSDITNLPCIKAVKSEFELGENRGAALALLLEVKGRLAVESGDRLALLEVAEEIIAIDSLFHQVYASVVIGLSLIYTGWGKEEGLSLLTEARKILDEIPRSRQKDDGERIFSEALASTGLEMADPVMIRRAIEFAKSIEDLETRYATLFTAIKSLAQLGGIRDDSVLTLEAEDEALKISETAPEFLYCLCSVAFQLARQGWREEARARIQKVEKRIEELALNPEVETKILGMLGETRNLLITRPVAFFFPVSLFSSIGQLTPLKIRCRNTTHAEQQLTLSLDGSKPVVVKPEKISQTFGPEAIHELSFEIFSQSAGTHRVAINANSAWGTNSETILLKTFHSPPPIESRVDCSITGREVRLELFLTCFEPIEEISIGISSFEGEIVSEPQIPHPKSIEGSWNGVWVIKPPPDGQTINLNIRGETSEKRLFRQSIPILLPKMESSQKCVHCNEVNGPGLFFCKHCGRPINQV